MKKLLVTILALTIAIPAFALDLQTARQQGIIGEQPDGYVVVLKASDDASKLANEVNAARKAEYQRISKENGQSVEAVAKIAAETIAKKLGK